MQKAAQIANQLQAPGNAKQLSVNSNNSANVPPINVPDDLQMQKLNSSRSRGEQPDAENQFVNDDEFGASGDYKDVFSRLANPPGANRRLRREASPDRTIEMRSRQDLGGAKWQMVHDKHRVSEKMVKNACTQYSEDQDIKRLMKEMTDRLA